MFLALSWTCFWHGAGEFGFGFATFYIFYQPFACVLRRMEHSFFKQLTDCAADLWVNFLFYNTLTPTEYLIVQKVNFDFRNLTYFGVSSEHN